MRKITFAILSMLLVFSASAQIEGKKIKDAVMIFDSIQVKPGDTLYFGSGSDRRGEFVYVYQPANFLIGAAEGGMPRKYAGKRATIKHFKVQSDKRTGNKTVAVINIDGGLNLVADLEGAVTSKEILAINGRSFDKKEEPKVVVVQQAAAPVSLADELTKLKKLLDDGVLTQAEYDAAKKKLLEKN